MCKFIGWDISDSDCSNWGNYANVTSVPFTGFTSNNLKSDWVPRLNVTKGTEENYWIFPTGKFITVMGKNTIQKNIFDVAGNVWEWTTEVPQYADGENAVIRGGSAHHDGSIRVATYRSGGNPVAVNASCGLGFRMVLYVE